jgi:hypothetical protein
MLKYNIPKFTGETEENHDEPVKICVVGGDFNRVPQRANL